MAGLTTKIISGVVTTGALGGGAYGIYVYNNTTDTLGNYLTNKKFTLTKRETTGDWDKVAKTYKLQVTEELKINSKTEATANDIKVWCNENLTKNINSIEDPLFKKASKWCVKYTTISEKLGSKTVKEANALNSEHNNFPQGVKDSIAKIKLPGETQTHTNGAKTVEWCNQNLNRSYSADDEFFFKNTKQYCFTT
ncbi:hypothetical protein A6V39_03915 [Candidatus Mycoplasma haematobovis]|uniref:Uncharacterized protein n=1 Tax=Candidatus Mycoplasma haematobovis TaxID=432608 RepID=A0A1A9QD64_9MOLU|nr:hypothetical protein [Candidatus Mycoplasma haematobovis]OAL10034.1 hypothetical protein A6V39_03915 [Candidatus Mycoplasma haematobovis]